MKDLREELCEEIRKGLSSTCPDEYGIPSYEIVILNARGTGCLMTPAAQVLCRTARRDPGKIADTWAKAFRVPGMTAAAERTGNIVIGVSRMYVRELLSRNMPPVTEAVLPVEEPANPLFFVPFLHERIKSLIKEPQADPGEKMISETGATLDWHLLCGSHTVPRLRPGGAAEWASEAAKLFETAFAEDPFPQAYRLSWLDALMIAALGRQKH